MKSSILFSDGACSGNPGPGGFGAIALLESGSNSVVKELGGASPSTTNNQMELLGVIEGLEWLALNKAQSVMIWTDSTYVIKGITAWVFGWKNKNWKTATGSPVLNQEFWERLLAVTGRFPKGALSWNYVPGHSGVPGNERCDEIAVDFAKGHHPALYHGPSGEYGVSLEVPENLSDLPKSSKKSSSSKKAQSYLSFIGGIVARHKDWASCERRVKGKPGAKFKKSTSSLSESDILKSWGLTPSSTVIKED